MQFTTILAQTCWPCCAVRRHAGNRYRSYRALLPSPETKTVLLAAFSQVVDAGNAVAAIIAAGIIPAGMEMMDKMAVQAAEAFAKAGYPLDAEAILIIELDGADAELATLNDQVTELLRSHGAYQIDEAHDAAQQARLWKGAQVGISGRGSSVPRLPVYGWHDSAQDIAQGAF